MRHRLAIAAVMLVGCVDHQPGVTGTQSFEVTLVTPADPGSVDNRLPDAARDVMVKITAHGPEGLDVVDTSFTGPVDVRAQFLGTVNPALETPPLTTIAVTDGESAPTAVTLPAIAYGPTTLWVEDAEVAPELCATTPGEPACMTTCTADANTCAAGFHCGATGGCDRQCTPGGNQCGRGTCSDDGRCEAPTYATGTSVQLWYRDPFIFDIQTPTDETAIDALLASPLQNRQIAVSGSRHPTDGKLVVTSIYAQGYTVSDVHCAAGGVPPCVAGDYDHMLVFSFSRPQDQNRCDLEVGEVIDGFSGAVDEFNGLTELGFPQSFVKATNDDCGGRVVDPALIPAPAEVDVMAPNDWFANGAIEFERNEAGLVALDVATLGPGFPIACPLDSDYDTYKQWKLDIGRGCGTPINVITAGVVSSWDPTAHVGQVLTRVVGSLRPVNLGAFNVWLIFPRSDADLQP